MRYSALTRILQPWNNRKNNIVFNLYFNYLPVSSLIFGKRIKGVLINEMINKRKTKYGFYFPTLPLNPFKIRAENET